ncbi:MAG: pyridoxamine 5'-phosphate oxidase family protein [Bacteroidota bacterium]
MGKQYQKLQPKHTEFIQQQKIFFVGTARAEGRVNISPKGLDTLRILDEHTVLWLNLTGSGNETAIHLEENNRMTLMFCAFEGNPLILRLYGHATVHHEQDVAFTDYLSLFGAPLGARQIMKVDIDLVQTSCGFAVPLMDFQEERSVLRDWAKKKGEDGIRDYWKDRNRKSIDGFESEHFKSKE